MRPARLFSLKPLAMVALLVLGIGLASNAVSATRLKLKCSVTPKMLPATGGAVKVHVSAGTQAVGDLLATIVRPNRTSDTQEMEALGNGEFEVTFEVPANETRSLQKYSLKAFARGEETGEATLNCGTVKVKSSAEAPSFDIAGCRVSPRQVPPAGGTVHVEVAIKGKKRGLTVRAIASGSQNVPQVDLIPGPGGTYGGDLMLPANTGSTAANFEIFVIARIEATRESVDMECGFASVAPADTSALVSGIAVAGNVGGPAGIRTFEGSTLEPADNFFPFGREFQGGVNVAAGDINGDGRPDVIVGVADGGAPEVRLLQRDNNNTEIARFLAYDQGFTGGVFVAAGDVNGDGALDVITGAGTGSTGGHVKVFDGRNGATLSSFLAFAPSFTGGVRVAAGDVNGDGRADIVVGAGAGGGPQVKVFSGADGSVLKSFFAFPPTFTGGVRVAVGDVNGDGRGDIITAAGAGGGPHVKVFNGNTGATLLDFFSYANTFQGGVNVAAGDVNGDGYADIITGAGPGAAGGHVKVFDGKSGVEIRSFLAFDPSFLGGISVAAWK